MISTPLGSVQYVGGSISEVYCPSGRVCSRMIRARRRTRAVRDVESEQLLFTGMAAGYGVATGLDCALYSRLVDDELPLGQRAIRFKCCSR